MGAGREGHKIRLVESVDLSSLKSTEQNSNAMLPYYEGYGKYDLPEKLKDELFDENGVQLHLISNLNKINILVGMYSKKCVRPH